MELKELLTRIWNIGTVGKDAQGRRTVVLTNQVAFFAACAPLPYQFFYLIFGLVEYLGIFLANLVFSAIYVVVLGLNYLGWHREAKITMFCNACVHALVATIFIGAEAGVQLFYFAISIYLALSFDRRHTKRFIALMFSIGILFVIAQFGFPAERALTPAPTELVSFMFVTSAMAVLMLLGGFSMLFRKEIEDAQLALIQTNKQLAELTTTDTLTGLGNRRQLDLHLARACKRLHRRFQPLSLIMCDVDHFKAYNDNLGHPAGDVCLEQVASALSKAVLRKGDVVARYGGEEFAVVLLNTDAEGAIAVAEALRTAVLDLELPHIAQLGQPFVTISVGVATLTTPAVGTLPSEMLKRADEALYLAKANGRNRVEALEVLSKQSSVTMDVAADAR